MDDFQVLVEQIGRIEPIEGADNLELAFVKGWQCIIRKGIYSAGDFCVYIPIDSVLPPSLEELILGGAKVKLHNGRVKTIKLRGCISQGLVVEPNVLASAGYWGNGDIGDCLRKLYAEKDLKDTLGIVKYQPPERAGSFGTGQGGPAKKKETNSKFAKYSSIPNLKNCPSYFTESDNVVATEKIHGTNFRAGWVPFQPKTFFSKLTNRFLKLFKKNKHWEFVYGSHNVQLNNVFLENAMKDQANVYAKMVMLLDLKNRIPKGYIIFGEIYGDGIQKNYNYGLKKGEHDFVLFDIMESKTGRYLNWNEMQALNHDVNHNAFGRFDFRTVPVLYYGLWDQEKISALRNGDSVLHPAQMIREGVVVEKLSNDGTRQKIKYISDDYLLRDNTDFH